MSNQLVVKLKIKTGDMSDMHEDIVSHISYERGKHAGGRGNTCIMDDYDAGWADGFRSKSCPTYNDVVKDYDNIITQLEELIYMVGDMPHKPTEDELLNYLIGFVESVKIKKNKITK